MDRPYKYTIFCNKTNKIVSEQNHEPLLHHLQTYEPTENPNVKKLVQTKTAYIDTRYEARLRLWEFITYTKNGLKKPRYNPYKNTQIGKSIPILNF